MSRLLGVALFGGGVAGVAQSPWYGTWVVDQAESTMKPGPVALERVGDRYTLHYDLVDTHGVYGFACDGRKYPTEMKLMIRCRGNGAGMRLDLSLPGKAGEAEQPIWRWVFRAGVDGRTMQATIAHTRVGKAPSVERDSYVRSGGLGAGQGPGCWVHGRALRWRC